VSNIRILGNPLASITFIRQILQDLDTSKTTGNSIRWI